ncbi:amino acid ABC transporter ATP-binding protein [Achromobacter xylosoxidans]|uniref:amino acid ABC transporter ATP-binding protein n=1 Tax=Alcaligenes xylosoxydans xylosoxydans TaxID=85698 RepID=UPI0015C903C4|nr:amino acid ABC transporter ATP-binding protein [Achromobacter xylosoxidans]NYS16180.1 amino acid ABC transporter ATP-binding protein [Achromobacter xylosoxidans]
MIRLEQIEKSFGGNLVLKQVDVAIAEGSVTVLIGPSGSGKSTLLRCVNLLEVPDRGTLEIGPEQVHFEPGLKLARDQVQRVRMQTGMVFQNFQLFPHQPVIGNVMEGLVTVQKWPADRARARAEELLRKVNMLDKAEAWPANLSGGQQQRVAIARALAPAPRVLLCDEPTSALDPGLAAEVVDVLRQLAAEGMTMLMATHDLRLAASVSREAVFLLDGNVVEAGASRDLFTRPRDPRTATFISTLTQEAGQIG